MSEPSETGLGAYEREDLETAARPRRAPPVPGKSTLTSRLGASPGSIARAVVAQLKHDASAPAQPMASPVVQARGDLDGPDVHAIAAAGTAGGGGSLPFLDEIQRAFGHHDVTGVRAHVGGDAADASAAMGARAYAAGDAVAFAAAPDLHLAAHEAAHVVQQRAGVRLSGGVGQAGDEYERHADAVADAVVRGDFVQELLDGMAHRGAAGGPAVQRERIPVQWGGTVAGDDSELDLTPVAEVWVNGRLTSSQRLGGTTGTVRVQPGQSGIVRVRLGVRYLIDNTFINDDGSAEQIGGRAFTCDASGRFRWGADTSRATPPPTTSAFQVDASSSTSEQSMTALFQFTGPQHSGRTVSGTGELGGGEVPASGGVTWSSGQTTNPAGALTRRYVVTIDGPTSFGDGGGGGGSGGDSSSSSSSTASSSSSSTSSSSSRATGGSARSAAEGGEGGRGVGTGGTAVASPDITVTQTVVVPEERGSEGARRDDESPSPPPAAPVTVPEPWVGIFQHEGDAVLDRDVLQELGGWLGRLSPEVRAGLGRNDFIISIETSASTTASVDRNQRLTEDRAEWLRTFVDARTPGTIDLRPCGELACDGTPRTDGRPLAQWRRATIRIEPAAGR